MSKIKPELGQIMYFCRSKKDHNGQYEEFNSKFSSTAERGNTDW